MKVSSLEIAMTELDDSATGYGKLHQKIGECSQTMFEAVCSAGIVMTVHAQLLSRLLTRVCGHQATA